MERDEPEPRAPTPREPRVRPIPVVGVMGSGSTRHARLAEPLGRALARMGVHLLTGGGRGVMEAVSGAFHEVPRRAGLVIGVLPAADDGPDAPPGHPDASRRPPPEPRPLDDGPDPPPDHPDVPRGPSPEPSPVADGRDAPPGYPNPWVELAIRTHLDARGGDGAGDRSRNHVNILTSDVVVALPGSAGTASEIELAIRYRRPLILLGDVGRAAGPPASIPATESVEEALEFVRATLGLGPIGALPVRRSAPLGARADSSKDR